MVGIVLKVGFYRFNLGHLVWNVWLEKFGLSKDLSKKKCGGKLRWKKCSKKNRWFKVILEGKKWKNNLVKKKNLVKKFGEENCCKRIGQQNVGPKSFGLKQFC